MGLGQDVIPQPLLPAALSAPPDSNGKCLGWAGSICFLSHGACDRFSAAFSLQEGRGSARGMSRCLLTGFPGCFPSILGCFPSQGFPLPCGRTARAPFHQGRPRHPAEPQGEGQRDLCHPGKLWRSSAAFLHGSCGDTVPGHPWMPSALYELWHLVCMSGGTSGSSSPRVLLGGQSCPSQHLEQATGLGRSSWPCLAGKGWALRLFSSLFAFPVTIS